MLFLHATATAGEGEDSITTGMSYDQDYLTGEPAGHGFGVHLGYHHGLADDWDLLVNGGYAVFLGPGTRHDRVSLVVGAAYVIDALPWIPRFHAGVGYFGPGVKGVVLPDFGVTAGFGLEYRRFREFGVGIKAEYRYLVRNRHRSDGGLTVDLFVAAYF